MKVKPSKDIELMLKGEGDGQGNVQGTVGVKIDF